MFCFSKVIITYKGMKNRTIFQQLRCQISLENSENRQGSKG